MNISEMIVKAREAKGLSQAELSKKTSISQVQISRIEGGEIKNPSFRDILTISNALNMPLGNLVTGNFKDKEDVIVIGKAEPFQEAITLKEESLIFFEAGLKNQALFSEKIIEKTVLLGNETLLISSNQIRNNLTKELPKIVDKGNQFIEAADPRRIRSIAKILMILSNEKNLKKLTSLEKDLSEKDLSEKRIGEVVKKNKLTIKPSDLKTITEFKNIDLTKNNLWLTDNTLETLLAFEVALNQILNSEDFKPVIFIDVLDLEGFEPYLIFLLEEAFELGITLRLFVNEEVTDETLKFFPWQLINMTINYDGLDLKKIGAETAFLLTKDNINLIDLSS
jgi:transcriptional regulator with XRE-family HTH domain